MTQIDGRSKSNRVSGAAKCRFVDLSLPIDNEMRGVQISVAKSLATDGWNATTLSLYSHAGTHLDAPRHFIEGGATIDQLPLDVFCGPATVVDLTPIEPRELITVRHLEPIAEEIKPGHRLLLRTDWYRTYGTQAYRDELPRISVELARWLVQKKVALIGVEPPSVADVNKVTEVTKVHQTLFRGGVVIVEGLANLDKLRQTSIEFIAVPMRIRGGDGCPVRAIAREEMP
jgi:kynurenine formamidase